MKVRKLKRKDAQLMYEWMHDDEVVDFMKKDFCNMTLEDCIFFIDTAQDVEHNMHLAITDEDDEYQGTVSLKCIDRNIICSSAEFAIILRKSAMGKGYAANGMKQIIAKGFDDLDLSVVYWNVFPENNRAVKFYDKNGYWRIDVKRLVEMLGITVDELANRGGIAQKKCSVLFGMRQRAAKYMDGK